ncbi:MAG: restriction endonuclease [Candidatus Obscuribacter sp.]|nr:restriction endonuclease [Candidatus Obscuribacter sp.]MBK9773696.1 restriction endonuclease [Candidatus Obscuribacter sp.]
MGALDFKEIPCAQNGPHRDEFELFAQEFLAQEGFRIVEGADRGPDNGRDLIVEEARTGPGGNTVVRWLVSCKHLAHSGSSVTLRDEEDIRDRIESHKCGGFIAFYSTVPSSGLSYKLDELKPKFELLVYNSALIERRLLDCPTLRTLAARYFPTSFNNWVRNSQYTFVEVSADPHKSRNNYFLRQPHSKLEVGLEEAKERKVLAFVVIFDSDHPTHSKLDYALGYFMEYQTTKKLVDQYFVPIVGRRADAGFTELVPPDEPLESALWIVLDTNGQIIRREGVYANPDEGLKRIREVIAGVSAIKNW